MKPEDEVSAPLEAIDFGLEEDCEACKLWTALKKSGPEPLDTWWASQIMIAQMCLYWHYERLE
jgi:hypothetical protein